MTRDKPREKQPLNNALSVLYPSLRKRGTLGGVSRGGGRKGKRRREAEEWTDYWEVNFSSVVPFAAGWSLIERARAGENSFL